MTEHDEFLAATMPAADLVYNLARRLATRPEDVEDIVQETYLRAFDAWMRGRKPRRVEPWIATIALNLGRSWLRRSSTRLEIPTEHEPWGEAGGDAEEEAIANVTRSEVHDAMWRLPEEQRIAIALMDLGGFTASEVARITDSPRGTVLARVHRGRKKLARMLRREVIHLDS